ncbi:diacylglycerol/lipid kinase family protein [Clostridium ganghwense]|uniref:Diacylglycerol kinase family lipid kinase n=1 Tax=Clostridium ganghwense TaxID=312089 RepID=A0ABT4CJT1_9CLOT|nr:diacylglycerol kinase family protein [Clostridium ganghwense]MCY6369307.1 diacylglycerol kinase family lipid kinase [Clostridium ganghwense]
MKHLFIINPKAGKGKAMEIIPEIEKIFKEIDEEYIIEITKRPGHATELVRNYVNNENYRVYSVGGDGTLNEVLNGMANSDSCLGVIPSGSGNDFVKSICKKTMSQNILKNTIIGIPKKVDLAKINDRYFINISSVGIDAEVTDNAKKLKKFPFVSGGVAYMLSFFSTIFSYKCRDIQLKIDDIEITSQITLLALANGKYYGGGMKVAPHADLQDGILDVCVVDKLSRTRMLALFPKLIKGEHAGEEEVSFYKGRKVTLTAEEEIAVNIDGEIIKSEKIDFIIIPQSIKIIIPQAEYLQ